VQGPGHQAQQSNASGAVNASAARDCPPAAAMVASSPPGWPASAEAPGGGMGKMSRAAVVAIVAGDFAMVGLVAALMFCYLWPRLSGRRRGRRLQQGEKIVYSSSAYGAAEVVAAAGAGDATFERGKMVFLEDLSCMQQRRHEAVRAGGAVARVRRDAGQGRVRHGVHSSRVPEDPMNLFYSIHTQG